MTSPTLELQKLMYDTLRDDAGLSALIGGRVYDRIPENRVFPYISFGASDELSEDEDCRDGFEISMQIDVWSREAGFPECRRIVDAVRRALPKDGLGLTDNALVYLQHRTTRIFRDPDGLTSHGAMTFEAFVEQP